MGHCSLLTLYRCDDTVDSTAQTFYIGGIDAFSNLQNASEYGSFVGMIRNLFISSVLVDLSSPVREENTVHGALFTSQPKCGGPEMPCSELHHSGCLDYDFESHCICSGGFNSQSCTNEESKHVFLCPSYNPLTLQFCIKTYYYTQRPILRVWHTTSYAQQFHPAVVYGSALGLPCYVYGLKL